MVLIERTIYARFSRIISENELIKLYTPHDEDISIAYKYAKGLPNIAVFIVMIKTFKVLNYFPSYRSIPNRIIEYIKVSTNICGNIEINVSEKTIQKYKLIIKRYLNIIDDKEFITNLVLKTVIEFHPIMEHPADVFNAVIEILIKNNCEFPAFSTLERRINSKRAAINNDIFEYVFSNLNEIIKKALDLMLETNEKGLPGFNYVKMNFQIDKKQFINHLKSMSKGIKFKNRNHQIANETFH